MQEAFNFRSTFVVLVLISLILAGCKPEPIEKYLTVTSARGAEGIEAAARITKRYIDEQRFVSVVYPTEENVTDEQVQNALKVAVVQPAYRESIPEGIIFIRCIVHEPALTAAVLIADRCVEEIRELAKIEEVTLSLEAN